MSSRRSTRYTVVQREAASESNRPPCRHGGRRRGLRAACHHTEMLRSEAVHACTLPPALLHIPRNISVNDSHLAHKVRHIRNVHSNLHQLSPTACPAAAAAATAAAAV